MPTCLKGDSNSFAFDIALSFVDALPVEEAKHYLRERVRQLERVVHRLDRRAEERMREEEEGRRPLTGLGRKRVSQGGLSNAHQTA